MGEWKRICCAVDPTEPSWRAMMQAAELARALGAELTLVHVRSVPPIAAMDLAVIEDERADAAEGPHATLAAWRAEAERVAGSPVRIVLLTGRPADTILRYASEQDFDAVVVGSRDGTTLGRLVLGSVAEHVALGANCPVLVVRPARAHEPRSEPVRAAV